MTDLQAYQMATAVLRLADRHRGTPWAITAMQLVHGWFDLAPVDRRTCWAVVIDLMTPAQLEELAALVPAYWPLGVQHAATN